MWKYPWLSQLSISLVLSIGSLMAQPTTNFNAIEEFAKKRYDDHQIKKDNYRNFTETAPEHVKKFYRDNHQFQTLDFVLQKKTQYLGLKKQKMGIWEAIELLNTLVDQSDPDINLPQCYHLYQTAEALKSAGYPRWMILTGFIHDLGKILALYGEEQWSVVGDTFPVGCAYAPDVVFSEYFAANPDSHVEAFKDTYGIYTPSCGFDQLQMSWGHDEYLYHVIKDYLPEEASYIIRYHSFYAAHREDAYKHFMNDKDHSMLPWLQLFSRYDLYSKSSEVLDMESLKPYYQELVSEFFPDSLDW